MYSQYAHHEETIQRTIDYFKQQPEVCALLLGGSIAHGFAKESSDVDVMMVISDSDYQERVRNQNVTFFTPELANYPGGYVDGKFISEGFLNDVEQRGSEPARFAFADAQILYSSLPDLAERLARIARYPVEEKIARTRKFYAQLEAWNWYVGEGFRKQNPYLINTAVSKLVLFGGRMLLAHNELLYPFHKWFMAVLATAKDKPDNIVEIMQTLIQQPTQEGATQFYELIKGFREWELDSIPWPNRFLKDTELMWMDGAPAVEDI